MDSDEYKKKCEWLADFYAAAASTGRSIQMANIDGWMDSTLGPIPQSDPQDWRLKPEPQKAWVVWDEDGIPVAVALDKWHAIKNAGLQNGTIQEINRPEPQ